MRSSIPLVCLALAASLVRAEELRGTITYGYGQETYLVLPDGERLELEGESVPDLRQFKRPQLGLGSDVDHAVVLEGERRDGRLRIERIVSPTPSELTCQVAGEGNDTTLQVEGRSVLAYGGAAFLLRRSLDGAAVRVRGWSFAGEDKLFVTAVRATVTRNAKLKRLVPMFTTRISVYGGRVRAGQEVWLEALAGDTWEGYYLPDPGELIVPKDAVDLRLSQAGLADLGQ
jgi:hypothetical protein